MSRFRATIGHCILVLLLLSWCTPPVRAGEAKDLLKIVPQDAWGFVIAKSLDNIDAKAGQLKDLLGLPIEGPVSAMALGMLDLGDTIDKSSPVGAVMLDAQKFTGQNAGALIVPAKDAKALLEKLGAEEPKDGVSKCTIMGEPAFAATKGKFVVVGPGEDAITRIAKCDKSIADSISGERIGVISKSDVYLSVSLRSIIAAYKEMIMMPIQMMTASGGVNAKDIEKLFKMFEEMASLDFAFTLDKTGLSLTVLMTPEDGSDLQGLITDTKNTSDPLLASLPQEKFLFTLAGVGTQSEHASKFGSEHPISGYLKMSQDGAELDQASLDTIDAEFIKLQKSIKRYALSLSSLASGGEGLFGFALVAETTDSKEFVQGVRKLYKAACSVSEDEDFVAVRKCVVHAADAEGSGSRKVDTLTIDFASMPDADKSEMKKMEKVVGKNLVVRFGAVDDKHVAVSLGGGAKRFEKIASASKSSEKLAADGGITEASGNLPSPRASEGFIAVDSILALMKEAAKAMGEKDEFPIDLPTLNAPVAFSSCVQGKLTRFDLVVPNKLIRAGKEAYDKYAASAKDEDFDDDDDSANAKPKAKAGKAEAKEGKKPKADDDEGDDDAEAKPPAKSKPSAAPKAKPKKPADDEDNDGDN